MPQNLILGGRTGAGESMTTMVGAERPRPATTAVAAAQCRAGPLTRFYLAGCVVLLPSRIRRVRTAPPRRTRSVTDWPGLCAPT